MFGPHVCGCVGPYRCALCRTCSIQACAEEHSGLFFQLLDHYSDSVMFPKLCLSWKLSVCRTGGRVQSSSPPWPFHTRDVVGIAHMLAYASHSSREPGGMLPEPVRSTSEITLSHSGGQGLQSPTQASSQQGTSVCTSKDSMRPCMEPVSTTSLNL